MGMYTEMIFGAALVKDTPEDVISALRVACGDETKINSQVQEYLNIYDLEYLFNCSSYYFGVSIALSKIWYDNICHKWIISVRSNIKNYHNQIDKFLDWIYPYIDYGSGAKNMYAVVTYEEDDIPSIYYKNV